MSKTLGQLLVEYFQKELEAGAEHKCRYVIHSIDGKYLDLLLGELNGKGVSIDVDGQAISIPFLLQDQHSECTIKEEQIKRGMIKSGRYPENQCTKVRNRCEYYVLASPAKTGVVNKSQESSQEVLVDPFDLLFEETLVRHTPDFNSGDRQKVRKSLEATFGSFGKWEVLLNLAEKATEADLASLQRCNGLICGTLADMLEGSYRSLVKRLAKAAGKLGLEDAFKEWQDSPYAKDNENVSQALIELRNHLEETAEDAATWLERGHFFYVPKEGATWWETLDFKCWLGILEEASVQLKPTSDLIVQLNHAEKVVLKVARQELVIVPNCSGLEFSLNEPRDDVASWEIGSKRTFDEISEVSSELLEPEINSHSRPLSVRCTLEDDSKVSSSQFICLDTYDPGVYLNIRSAKDITPPKQDEKENGEDWFQTVELPNVGEFDARLYIRKELSLSKITGISISAELEGLEKEIKFHLVTQGDFDVYRFQLYSDEECEYVIEWHNEKQLINRLRVKLSASDEQKQRRTRSQFETLKEQHLDGKQTRSEISAERNDCFANRLQALMIGRDDSYHPIAIDIEYASNPLFQLYDLGVDGPLLVSDVAIPSNDDPRPKSAWNVPEELLDARREVLERIRAEEEGGIVERIDLSSLFSGPAEDILENYVEQFHNWLKADRDAAKWFDVHPILGRSTANKSSLSPEPLAILVSPLHPVRLYWQYRAQRLLTSELEKEQFSPGAGLLDSQTPTSQMALHLNHLKENRTFIGIDEFSPYWGLLWNERLYGSVDSLYKVKELFGESGKSTAGTLSAYQVEAMMDEIGRLTPARAETSILIAGQRGSSTCNSGILNWVSKDGKYFDEREMTSGKLTVMDITSEKVLPDAKDLALYSEETDGGLTWYATDHRKIKNSNHDLAIIPVLPPNSTEIQSSQTSSATSISCLTRYTIEWSDEKGTTRKQLGNASFISQANASVFDCTVREMAEGAKRACLRLSFDHKPVVDIIRAASFCGVSGIGLDAVSLSATFKKQAVLWSYSIPALDAKNRDLDSYYILADAHDEIKDRMQKQINSLADAAVIADGAMRELLEEFGLRGMNSLNHLVSNHSKALGDLGVICAARVLQPINRDDGWIPEGSLEEGNVNFLVPLDPLKDVFSQARKKYLKVRNVLPDLLAISIDVASEKSLSIHITPIEAKCRSSKALTGDEVRNMLKSQCSEFARFFHEKLGELAEESPLWKTWRSHILCELIVQGAKTRATWEGSCWNSDEALDNLSVLTEQIMRGEYSVTVDPTGRLVAVDKTIETGLIDADQDKDGFDETLKIKFADAINLLNDNTISETFERLRPSNSWSLLAPKEKDAFEEVTTVVDEEESAPDVKEVHQVDSSQVDEPNFEKAVSTETLSPVFLGVTPSGEEVVWSPKPKSNRHGLIVGKSGSGKTYLIKDILAGQVGGIAGSQLYVDYNDDFTDLEFRERFGMELIDATDGIPLNPLVPVADPATNVIHIIRHIIELTDSITKTFSLGDQQSADFKNALGSLYEVNGFDPKKKYQAEELSDQKWPKFDELNQRLMLTKNQKLMNRVDPLFDLGIFNGDGGTMGDVLSKPTVLRLGSLPGENIKRAVAELFLRGIYQTMLKRGHSEKLELYLVIDEAHKIAKLNTVSTLLKEARKYGVSVWLSSQEIVDFTDSILDNSGTYIFMAMNLDKSAKFAAKQLTNPDLSKHIQKLPIGHAYIKSELYSPYKKVKLMKEENRPD